MQESCELRCPRRRRADLSALRSTLSMNRSHAQSLGVSLILSQRDAAIGLIAGSNASCKQSLLTELSRGAFTTVGVAQLTTSRQGAAPPYGQRKMGKDIASTA